MCTVCTQCTQCVHGVHSVHSGYSGHVRSLHILHVYPGRSRRIAAVLPPDPGRHSHGQALPSESRLWIVRSRDWERAWSQSSATRTMRRGISDHQSRSLAGEPHALSESAQLAAQVGLFQDLPRVSVWVLVPSHCSGLAIDSSRPGPARGGLALSCS